MKKLKEIWNSKSFVYWTTTITCGLVVFASGISENSLRLSQKISDAHSRNYLPDIEKQLVWQDYTANLHKELKGYQTAVPFYVLIKEEIFKGYDLPESLK